MENVLRLHLRLSPEQIEGALQHCTTEEQCDGCPLLEASQLEHWYCGHVLNMEVLHYIQMLKVSNQQLSEKVKKLEAAK